MVKYVHKFQNETDFNRKYNGRGYLEPWLSLTDNAGGVTGDTRVDYNKKEHKKTPEEFIAEHIDQPLKITARESGTFVFGSTIMITGQGS